jgi:hypothetical protein
VLANEVVAKAVANAERYVQQYQYRQDIVTEGGQPRVHLSLVAQFDRGAVDRLVRERGLKVWNTAARAPLLTWLAVDDGGGARLAVDANDARTRTLSRAAQARGLRIVLPNLVDDGHVALATQSVVDGDIAALSSSAARYQTDTVLVGRVRRDGDAYVARWTLAQIGQPAQEWESRDSDPAVVLAAGADGAADRIGGRDAAVPEERRITTARVWVSGLQSAQDYARLLGLLGRSDLLREVQAEQARGDGVLLKLTLNLALDRWLTYLPADGPLRVVSARPPIEGVEATLTLSP